MVVNWRAHTLISLRTNIPSCLGVCMERSAEILTAAGITDCCITSAFASLARRQNRLPSFNPLSFFLQVPLNLVLWCLRRASLFCSEHQKREKHCRDDHPMSNNVVSNIEQFDCVNPESDAPHRSQKNTYKSKLFLWKRTSLLYGKPSGIHENPKTMKQIRTLQTSHVHTLWR